MNKTLKQKVYHILFNKDGKMNLKVPQKLRWSYFNKLRRNNFDRDLERAELAEKRSKANLKEMRNQLNEIQSENHE